MCRVRFLQEVWKIAFLFLLSERSILILLGDSMFFKVSDIKPAMITGAQFSISLAVSFFIFQISQSWVDTGIDYSTLRWLLPICISGFFLYLLIFQIHLKNYKKTGEVIPPADRLSSSILEYGEQLYAEGRDKALVNLRNNFSETLHILGFHEARTKLGEISLQSATILASKLIKSQILVDDLGWANYLLGNKEIAVQNINRGVQIANTARCSVQGESQVELGLIEAKGLRHLSIITEKDSIDDANKYLNDALLVLQSLKRGDLREVKRDIGQIHHARAFVAAMNLNVHREGVVRLGDQTAIGIIDKALLELRKASEIFHDIGDLDRYTKALFLDVRLLEAKGATMEAKEISALRDRTLAASEWIRPEGTKTITGL